ncbi:MAG: hypothetical protein U5P41_16155 [Gammaproteobacteria bacterium]|nr:hypothetical protein [Gammaproteobacteria bacterium]
MPLSRLYSHPRDGGIERIELPPTRASDPHTLVADGAGHTCVYGAGRQSRGAGAPIWQRRRRTSGPVLTDRARPYGIVVDSRRQPGGVALFGTHKLAIAEPGTHREIA